MENVRGALYVYHRHLLLLLLQGPLDERSAAYVVAMALLGLQHCHQLGIIYRGMSAITLLMTESGLVQLADFRSANCCSGWRGYRMDRVCRAHILTLLMTESGLEQLVDFRWGYCPGVISEF